MTADVLDFAAWGARLRAETQPVEDAGHYLSEPSCLAIASAGRIANGALRAGTLEAIGEALGAVGSLYDKHPLGAIGSYLHRLVSERNRLIGSTLQQGGILA